MDSLIPKLCKDKPNKIPTPPTTGIIVDPALGVIKEIRTERVLPSQAPKLAEEIIRGNVVVPSGSDRLSVLQCIDRYKHFFDTPDFSQGINTMGVKRLQHLVDLRL